MPPSRPPARLVERITPSAPGYISSWATLPRRRAVSKPSPISTPLIAWMPITAPASWLSSRLSPLVNEPSPTGNPWTTTSTMPPRVSPSFLAASISSIIEAFGVLVERPNGTGVDPGQIGELRRRPVVGLRRADGDHMRQHLDAERLPQKRPRDGAGRDAGRRLAGAGTLQHRAGVVEAVLEHACVVGVARPRPGQRRVAGAVLPARRDRRGRRPSRSPTSAIRCCRPRSRSGRPA